MQELKGFSMEVRYTTSFLAFFSYFMFFNTGIIFYNSSIEWSRSPTMSNTLLSIYLEK